MLARIFFASRDFLISSFTSSSRDSGNGCLGVEMDNAWHTHSKIVGSQADTHSSCWAMYRSNMAFESSRSIVFNSGRITLWQRGS